MTGALFFSNHCRHKMCRKNGTCQVTSLTCFKVSICSHVLSRLIFKLQATQIVFMRCVVMAVFVSSMEVFLQNFELLLSLV